MTTSQTPLPRRLPAPMYAAAKKISDGDRPWADPRENEPDYDPWADPDDRYAPDESYWGDGEDDLDLDYGAWDTYLVPDLDQDVLANKANLTDPGELQHFEEAMTATRMIELMDAPLEGSFDLAHMQAIHAHLFQDVYEWAGDKRVVDLNKAGHRYAPLGGIETIWERQHEALADEDYLRGIADPSEFADRLAFHWGMVNFAHAFREGNTRSQMMFFSQLAEQAGWELDVPAFAPDAPASIRDVFVEARFHHQSAGGFDHRPLAQVLERALSPLDPERALSPLDPERAKEVEYYAPDTEPLTSPLAAALAEAGGVPGRSDDLPVVLADQDTRPRDRTALKAVRRFPELAPGGPDGLPRVPAPQVYEGLG